MSHDNRVEDGGLRPEILASSVADPKPDPDPPDPHVFGLLDPSIIMQK